MQRDLDLIRDLLIFYESDGVTTFPSADLDTIGQHLVLLVEAGLVDGIIRQGGSDGPVAVPLDGRTIISQGKERLAYRLTWKGHDFLAVARDDHIWNKAKAGIGTAITGMTLDMLKEYLKHKIMEKLGISC